MGKMGISQRDVSFDMPSYIYFYLISPPHKHKSLWGEISIKEVPQLDRPLLLIYGEEDKLFPLEHAYYLMDWAIGEKELKSYLEGKHACINFLDEVVPYSIDWPRKHLSE